MARGQGGDEPVLGVEEGAVATERGGRGAYDWRLALDFDAVGAVVGVVAPRGAVRRADPAEVAREMVLVRTLGHATSIVEASGIGERGDDVRVVFGHEGR